ncbi:MAG: N-acetylmuramoyl-L-alanine amidase [Flavobacterium sp.]
MCIKNKIQIAFLFIIAAVSSNSFAQSSKFKVVLDAGHGGKDYGAIYSGHIEKNIALAVVQKVGKILEKDKSIDVIYTRKTDVFIELIERTNIANKADANIFVSIHCNANKNTTANGSETYVMGVTKNASNLEAAKLENQVVTLESDYKEKYEGYDPKSPQTMIGMTLMQEEYLENSINLAAKIQDNFTDQLKRRNRGVKQAQFLVLHKAYMPRVLVEMGFISNPEEGKILDSDSGQDDIAEAIAAAIVSYKKAYYGSGSVVEDEKPSKRVETKTPTKQPVKEVVEAKAPESKPVAAPVSTKGVVFKVQLAVSGTKLETVPHNFNGLNSISMEPVNNLYRYMYGEAASYDEAKNLLAQAKEKGYTTAFVIAFKDGKKITVQEALK